MSKYLRYIKDKFGKEEILRVSSVNLTKRQQDFVREEKINLSQAVRDLIESWIPVNWVPGSKDSKTGSED